MKLLVDRFGRIHDYLRISLTDKCNLRCSYCLPEDINFLPNNKIMNLDEMYDLAKVFVYEFGFKKIRFTGGEPLMSKNAYDVFKKISNLPVELAITTNGFLLDDSLPLFKEIRMSTLNISLDTLKRDRFIKITKRDYFDTIRNNIDAAISSGFKVKINMVVMKNVNDDEILDFVNWSVNYPIQIRFIEFMPFYAINWDYGLIVPLNEMKQLIQKNFEIEKLIDKPNSTSKDYRVVNALGSISFISSLSEPFCKNCNRMRLSSDGKLRNCLFANYGVDLLSSYRKGVDIGKLIEKNIQSKAEQHGNISLFENAVEYRMSAIGG